MGAVYLARDRTLHREIALKLMRLDRWRPDRHERLLQIFEDEARTTARLNHPNIVTLHGFGEWSGLLYLVLEYLQGENLAERLKRGRLSEKEALHIAAEVARGLLHAHERGVLHRDLKPHNVFVGSDGRVKVLDFGLAMLDEEKGAGTPAYMAPEQRRGEKQDERTDVFGLGAVLFEMIEGERPLLPEHGHSPRSRSTKTTQKLLAKMLEPNPRDRFANMTEALSAIERAKNSRRRFLKSTALATLISGAAAAYLLLSQPTDPNLEGLWAYVPEGRAAVILKKTGPDTYFFEYTDAPKDAQPSPDHFLIHGDLSLFKRKDGQLMLGGKVADQPGWGKSQVGVIEFEVLADDRLQMVRSEWGKTHDHYHHQYPPWLMLRVSRSLDQAE